MTEQKSECAFCGQDDLPMYGFDMDWDAFLCWPCHLAQNYLLFMARYRVTKTLERLFKRNIQ